MKRRQSAARRKQRMHQRRRRWRKSSGGNEKAISAWLALRGSLSKKPPQSAAAICGV
jgi:hypothetical protein